MITDIMPFIERFGIKFNKNKYKVKKVDTDKRCNNERTPNTSTRKRKYSSGTWVAKRIRRFLRWPWKTNALGN